MIDSVFSLKLENFAELFGTEVDDIPADCRELIFQLDFRYRKLNQEERDAAILSIINRINSPELTKAGKSGKPRWEKGWSENLENFIKKYDPRELVPRYIRPNQIVRMKGDYVMPLDPRFELNYYTVFQRWLFKKYLRDYPSVYEFGCGPAHNLAELACLYPQKLLHGFEWVTPPLEIMHILHKKLDYNITGHLFDMFSPDKKIKISRKGAVLAIGALEQLGTNFETFLQYILSQSPSLFIHVDSILEWYDKSKLLDNLAARFDERRNYLKGHWPRLEELEKEGRIEIIKKNRSNLGSLFHDGYSLIVWKPK